MTASSSSVTSAGSEKVWTVWRGQTQEAEFEDQRADGRWVNHGAIKPRGQLLKLSATRAHELGLARFVVDSRDPAEVYARYGVDPAQVKDASPAWLDQFVTQLKLERFVIYLHDFGSPIGDFARHSTTLLCAGCAEGHIAPRPQWCRAKMRGGTIPREDSRYSRLPGDTRASRAGGRRWRRMYTRSSMGRTWCGWPSAR